jgi:hypothetical protein
MGWWWIWYVEALKLKFGGPYNHFFSSSSTSRHSFSYTNLYVPNITYPRVQVPSCESESISQEHLHTDNTQYRDCCTGDSWRRFESYLQWRVFELCSSEPWDDHPLFSGLLIQSYYHYINDTLINYILKMKRVLAGTLSCDLPIGYLMWS